MSLPEGNDKEGWFRLGWLQLSVGHFDVAKWLKDINLRNDYSRNTQLGGREGSMLEVMVGRRGQKGKRYMHQHDIEKEPHTHDVRIIHYMQWTARDILYAPGRHDIRTYANVRQASRAYIHMYIPKQ